MRVLYGEIFATLQKALLGLGFLPLRAELCAIVRRSQSRRRVLPRLEPCAHG